MLDREISVGPFDVNLADLGWESKIQEKLDKINDVLLGLFVLFVLGMGFSGLALLGCVPAALFPQTRVLPTVNLAASSLAFLSLAIASIIVTVAATKGVDEINDAAEEVLSSVGSSVRDDTADLAWTNLVVVGRSSAAGKLSSGKTRARASEEFVDCLGDAAGLLIGAAVKADVLVVQAKAPKA